MLLVDVLQGIGLIWLHVVEALSLNLSSPVFTCLIKVLLFAIEQYSYRFFILFTISFVQ